MAGAKSVDAKDAENGKKGRKEIRSLRLTLLMPASGRLGLRSTQHTAAVLYLCLCTLWQNEFRFRMTLVGGFVFLVPRFGDADMAKKLSPEEAAVMIIRRRLQQVETAKKASRRSDEPEKARAAKAQPPKPSRAGR